MFNPNYIHVMDVIMEASSKEDRDYMRTMEKNDIHQANGQGIQNLYELTMKNSDIDFGQIPASAGDFEKCKYYESTVQCIQVLKELHEKARIQDETLGIVKKAISNIIRFKPQFVMGFRMKHDYVMLTYNAIAMAIVDTVGILSASYVDYVITSTPEYKLNTTKDKGRVQVTKNALISFNQACENGTLASSLKYMLDSKQKAFDGTTVVIAGVVIMALTSIVPLMRELIYFYYSSRVQISDYLKMQSDFLEMNKLAVEASRKSPQERKSIIKKQDKLISDLRRLSDKVMIDNVDTNDVVKKKIKEDEAIFSLPSIDKQLSKNKLNGDGLLIF